MAALEERIEILETRVRNKDGIAQDHGDLKSLTKNISVIKVQVLA